VHTRLLTLVRSPAARRVAQRLSRQGDFLIDEGPGDGEVVKCLLADPPAGLLVEVDLGSLRTLEAVSACGVAALQIPLLVLIEGAVEAEQVTKLPSEVNVFDVQRSPETLAAEIAVAISSPIGPRQGGAQLQDGAWEVADHLLLAVICGISAHLEFQADEGGELTVEIIGGDLWNAYGVEFEGGAALEAHLSDRPRRVGVRSLQVLPGQRQLRRKGFETLRYHGLPTRSGHREPTSRDTKEVLVEDVRNLMRQVPGSPSPADPGVLVPRPTPPKQSSAEHFEELLSEGLRAAMAMDYPRAERAFEKAVALDSADPRARMNLKKVRRQLAARRKDSG